MALFAFSLLKYRPDQVKPSVFKMSSVARQLPGPAAPCGQDPVMGGHAFWQERATLEISTVTFAL